MHVPLSIYLDHHASTPPFDEVVKAMHPYWSNLHGNPHSSEHARGWHAHKVVEGARGEIARLFGGLPDEVVFTSGATEANNLAILGFASEEIEQVVVSQIEHACVLRAATEFAKMHSVPVVLIGVDVKGYLNVEHLEQTLKSKRSLVSVGYVNNEIGVIQDIQKIGRICKAYDAFLHADVAQAPFACDLSVLSETVDAASISGHKMGGPMGVGALFLSAVAQESLKPRVFGGGQEKGFRSGTVPVPLVVGLAQAAKMVRSEEFRENRLTMKHSRKLFLDVLSSQGIDFEINGPTFDWRHPGNLNLQLAGCDAQDVLLRVQPKVSASTGSACSSGKLGTSHVLEAIGLTNECAESSIRLGFGPNTTQSEAIEAAEILAVAVKE
ncbi:cysteine desulfurase family protein [Ruegeria arenilitoris]|uniref:cysteine desulfurase family protein n=1 Tax=Ruegeria arenilitoris TaxID=1173585 RepID=UPI00147AE640